MAEQETTTKFKVDISELKKQFADANRQIRLVNSEFKAATAGMDDWGSSADGLGAKIKQLNGVVDAEKSKLQSLNKTRRSCRKSKTFKLRAGLILFGANTDFRIRMRAFPFRKA